MAQKVTYLCDPHLRNDGVEREKAVTGRITVDDESVDVDLCLDCAAQVQEHFGGLLKVGTLVKLAAGRKRARGGTYVPPAERPKIRNWGRSNGYNVNERGRLPEQLVTEYYKAARQADLRT
jgi:nucleoid-associated protein Lsr2